jgi:hypothetical protein
MTASLSFPTAGPSPLCHLLRLPDELRFMVYEEVFTDANFGLDYVQWHYMDLTGEGAKPDYLDKELFPAPNIRYACKQLYYETSDLFFQRWGLIVAFTNTDHLDRFLRDMGKDNRRRLRYLQIHYDRKNQPPEVHTHGDNCPGNLWERVAGLLRKYFGEDDQVQLRALELFSRGRLPPLPQVASVLQVIKLVRFFPCLKSLVLERAVLLGDTDEGNESSREEISDVGSDVDDDEFAFKYLPVVNFLTAG